MDSRQSTSVPVATPRPDTPRYNRGLHWTAILTTVATFPLIFMGGLVTSKNAGLSVPDWPTSFGHNMFALPWHQWVQGYGVIYEHSHRLLGTLVGVLAIALTAVAWWAEPRRWVRWLATGVLIAVVVQGILGGLRVVWRDVDFAVVHACLAQAFFCLSALVAVVTSRWWLSAPSLAKSPDALRGQGLVRLAVTCCVLIYAQLVLGALVRHYEAGLAIPDFPFAYGNLLPPLSAERLEQLNDVRQRMGLDAVNSLSLVWLHFAHRVVAFVITILLLNLGLRVLLKHREQRALRTPAALALVQVFVQVTLGALTVLVWARAQARPADVATLHVAVGALLLVTTFVLAIRAARIYWPRLRPRAPAGSKASAILNGPASATS